MTCIDSNISPIEGDCFFKLFFYLITPFMNIRRKHFCPNQWCKLHVKHIDFILFTGAAASLQVLVSISPLTEPINTNEHLWSVSTGALSFPDAFYPCIPVANPAAANRVPNGSATTFSRRAGVLSQKNTQQNKRHFTSSDALSLPPGTPVTWRRIG